MTGVQACALPIVGRSRGGTRTGLISGMIYATMLLPFGAANIVTPDTPLVMWTTAAFFFFWKSVEPGARRVVLWKMLMCAAFAGGFATKGPAVLIPSAGMFVFLVVQRRALRYFITPWALAGLGIFVVLGLGWYAYVRSEEHTSELQSHSFISYAVFCLKKKNNPCI